jgi:hypothetical protein
MTTVALVVSLVTAACGSSTESTTEPEPLPFDAVLLELFGTTDTDAYLAGAERRAAEIVATCMEEAGFEFVIPAPATVDLTEDRDSLDYARREGFGVITGFVRTIDETDFLADAPVDPNLTYLETLPAAEIDRFLITLNGAPAEPGQFQDGGCNGKASDEAYADWLRFFDALPNYRSLGEERDTHPDWLAAQALWQDCMADRGYDYTEPDAIMSDVTNRMREIVEARYPGGDLPLVASGDGLGLDPEVKRLLDEMAVFERDAAVANFECTAPIADRFEAVDRLVQQDFVDRNRAAIDDLLAANRAATSAGG